LGGGLDFPHFVGDFRPLTNWVIPIKEVTMTGSGSKILPFVTLAESLLCPRGTASALVFLALAH
jgi:hypothetical protein